MPSRPSVRHLGRGVVLRTLKNTSRDWKFVAEAAGHTSMYPADDIKVPLKSRAKQAKLIKLRKSITPGKVLILVAGNNGGKRVVFLKQLESGLLLVSGPSSINGVGLRRVHQAFVIATSTSVPLTGVDVSGVNDSHFGKRVTAEERQFRVQACKRADQALTKNAKAVHQLSDYLATPFKLNKNDKPHAMVF